MDLKEAARSTVASWSEKLIDLSHRIHAKPELGFQERMASRWMFDFLSDAGFGVTLGACGMETAFVARAGNGPLHFAICAEYDCLPGIGHACGHNIIAAMAAGAGIAAARFAKDLDATIYIFGTPAEEIGNNGGKIVMLERGAFNLVHTAMMVHPAPVDVAEPPIIAATAFDARYTGRAAHASAFPELGINAADAVTIAQTAIGLLRQHIRTTDRIHGIVTDGGDAPNVVPAHAGVRYMMRSAAVADLEELRGKVFRCFEAGALATGAKLEITGGNKPYAEMHHDHELAALYRRNAEALGRTFITAPGSERAAVSTDMGNVSIKIPAIHPTIGIDSLPAVNHQPEFTAHCITPAADKAVIDGSIAMAWTIIDIAGDAQLRKRLMGGKRP
ncbi:MAG TPA: M20 family metallopeptidase [Candidatus Binataceae bacterium]|nr:M20 family metallopeptidase [Candidatus Binataceae bacterium]